MSVEDFNYRFITIDACQVLQVSTYDDLWRNANEGEAEALMRYLQNRLME